QPSPVSPSRKWPVLAVIRRGVGLFAASLRRLSHPQLAELGAAADALGQGERHLAGVVIGNEHDWHAAPIEPHDVPRAAVYLELDGRDGRSIDFYDCL